MYFVRCLKGFVKQCRSPPLFHSVRDCCELHNLQVLFVTMKTKEAKINKGFFFVQEELTEE